MQYVCDAAPYTWFRIETAAEAAIESQAMDHAVEKYFRMAHEEATRSYVPPPSLMAHEQSIGLKAHVQGTMPIFLTLRDGEGKALVTAMLPQPSQSGSAVRPIVVGSGNSDPYTEYSEAIAALGRHYGMELPPERCYPYRR